MGYYVKKLKHKKTEPYWKLQFLSFKKENTKNSTAKKPKREWDIPRARWLAPGFSALMTLEEAKTRTRQLNAQLQIKRQEEQVRKIAEQQAATQKRFDSVLPIEFVSEFERCFLRTRDSQTEQGIRKNTRSYVTWRAAQRMIVVIAVDPSEWFYHTHSIYDYFYSQKMSLRYISSVLKFANLWGFFICRKLGRPFLPVPFPRGYERLRLIDAHYQKKGTVRASKAISPNDLEKVKGSLNQSNFNWLFLSVWLGLRPKEIDNLHENNCWKIEDLPTGRKVLWVFQTKIVALPREDRWKPIPILFIEQAFALEIIKSGHFRRPLLKTMRRHFGNEVNLYGGRKGFADLMLSKNQTIENISVWMGHSNLQRTWYSYKDRRRFHLEGFPLWSCG